MAPLTVEQTIDAPPETVFARCTDFGRMPESISGIDSVEMLTDGPAGTGTRFRETRTLMGRKATEEMEVAEFEPPRRFVLACQSCGMVYRSEHVFEPAGGGTRLRLTMSGRPVTLMARLMSPLAALMKKTMEKCVRADLDDLKRACEQDVAAPG